MKIKKIMNNLENISLSVQEKNGNAVGFSVNEQTKKMDWAERMRAIHQHIKDNLEYYRKKMLEHYENEKKFTQSKYDIATCGYCFRDKYNKSRLHIVKGEWNPKGSNIYEIVCKICLFKNKIWKGAKI